MRRHDLDPGTRGEQPRHPALGTPRPPTTRTRRSTRRSPTGYVGWLGWLWLARVSSRSPRHSPVPPPRPPAGLRWADGTRPGRRVRRWHDRPRERDDHRRPGSPLHVPHADAAARRRGRGRRHLVHRASRERRPVARSCTCTGSATTSSRPRPPTSGSSALRLLRPSTCASTAARSVTPDPELHPRPARVLRGARRRPRDRHRRPRPRRPLRPLHRRPDRPALARRPRVRPGRRVPELPWIDMQGDAVTRLVAMPVIHRIGRVRPRFEVPREVSGLYAAACTATTSASGTSTRLEARGVPSRPARVAARDPHRSGPGRPRPRGARPDARDDLDPQRSPHLRGRRRPAGHRRRARRRADPQAGRRALLARDPVQVEGALHDVTLSPQPARRRVFAELDRFLTAYVENGAAADPVR